MNETVTISSNMRVSKNGLQERTEVGWTYVFYRPISIGLFITLTILSLIAIIAVLT